MSGNSKVLMFAHINPSIASASESNSTLTFAQRVASVTLGQARKNTESQELVEAREVRQTHLARPRRRTPPVAEAGPLPGRFGVCRFGMSAPHT